MKEEKPKKRSSAVKEKARLFVEISGDLDSAMRVYAKTKRVDIRTVVEQALRRFLNTDVENNRDAVISKRLQRIDRQMLALMETNRLQEETLALFVQVSLGTMPEPVSQREKTEFKDRMNRRWVRFVEQLTDVLAERSRGIYSYLPKEFVATTADFPSPPPTHNNTEM